MFDKYFWFRGFPQISKGFFGIFGPKSPSRDQEKNPLKSFYSSNFFDFLSQAQDDVKIEIHDAEWIKPFSTHDTSAGVPIPFFISI